MQVMEDIFIELDKYNDGILKRQDFVHALRTDTRVVPFIDTNAVFLNVERKYINLDEVLREI